MDRNVFIDVVEDYVNCMNIELTEDEKETLLNKLRAEFKEKMMAVWGLR